MAEEVLTPEETAALQEMETDAGEDIEVSEQPEPEAQEAEPEAKEPEFKSTRTDEQKPPEGFVPHQAMHAERVKRQELEQRLKELEAKLSQPKEQEAAPEFVDPLENPEGFRKYQEYQSKTLQERIEAQERMYRQQQAQQQVIADVQRSEAEFVAKTPDYNSAVDHLYSSRVTELQNMGYGQQEIAAQVQRDAQAIYQAAKAIGMNPAEMAYMRAQSLGYRPASQAATPAPQARTEADKVQALARAQDATSGVGGSGAPQEGALTIAQLAKMSEDELAKIPEADFKRVMGA